MPIIEGAYRYFWAGTPGTGTSAVQTLNFTGTAVTTRTIVLGLEGFVTAPITVAATAAAMVSAIDAALEALPNVGTGGVTTAAGTYTAGAGTITCTFALPRPVALMTLEVNSMAGAPAPTLAITTTTPGIKPDIVGPARGAVLINTL